MFLIFLLLIFVAVEVAIIESRLRKKAEADEQIAHTLGQILKELRRL
ncbi:hypothetical protein [Saccharibacillus sacchari]|uniref:Uncharacterized protein n=1 Tax=Saccharibacillus sacchari TaxID=456493 RepID=A0ACC6PA90_9BACL